MPIYVFNCCHCNKKLERYFSFKDMPNFIQCPYCGSEARRIPFPSANRIHIGKGIRFRVYQAWDKRFGSPTRDIADQLKGQDRPSTEDVDINPDTYLKRESD